MVTGMDGITANSQVGGQVEVAQATIGDQSRPRGVSTYEDAQPKELCPTSINPSLWSSSVTPEFRPIMPGLWNAVDKKISEKLAEKCFNPGDTIDIKIPYTRVYSNGFHIYTMRNEKVKLCFPAGVKISISMKFKVGKVDKGGAKLKLLKARIKFNRPVITQSNYVVPLGEALERILDGDLSKQDMLELAEVVKIRRYDREDAGILTKPQSIALDTIELTVEKNGRSQKPAILMKLESRNYRKKGWGAYTFGSDKKVCSDPGSLNKPGEFLGDRDGIGDGECRLLLIGNTVRHAILKWILNKWGAQYKHYLEAADDNPVLAMMALSNEIMGVHTAGCNWSASSKEQDLLSKDYLDWKAGKKAAK